MQCPCSLLTLRHHNQFVYDDDDNDDDRLLVVGYSVYSVTDQQPGLTMWFEPFILSLAAAF